jgi:hypothetical protein
LKRNTTLQVLTAVGCLLFIASMLLPFLQVRWTGIKIPEALIGPQDLWSFKETYVHGYLYDGFVVEVDEWWFASYWSRGGEFGPDLGIWVGPVLVFMFEAQILTIISAALAFLKAKPRLLLATSLLSAFTIACMGFIGYAMSRSNEKTLQAGFWLALCSALSFCLTSLESWRHHRRTQGAQQPNLLHHPPRMTLRLDGLSWNARTGVSVVTRQVKGHNGEAKLGSKF